MANHRCYRNSLFEEDGFYELSDRAKLLYFSANTKADDDGFFNGLRGVLNQVEGAGREDFQELINAGYVIEFEGGVYCLADWLLNNSIRKDRYRQTVYQNNFKRLEIYEGRYRLKPVDRLATTGCHSVSEFNVSEFNVSECSEIQVNEIQESKESQVHLLTDNSSFTESTAQAQSQIQGNASEKFTAADFIDEQQGYLNFSRFCKSLNLGQYAYDIYTILQSQGWKTKDGKTITDFKGYIMNWEKREKNKRYGGL